MSWTQPVLTKDRGAALPQGVTSKSRRQKIQLHNFLLFCQSHLLSQDASVHSCWAELKSTESTGWLKACSRAMARPGEQQQQHPDQPSENRALSNRATAQLSAAPARFSSQHLPTFHRAIRQRHYCQTINIPVGCFLHLGNIYSKG